MLVTFIDHHILTRIAESRQTEIENDPGQELINNNIRGIVMALPEPMKQTIVMHYFEQKEIKTISLELNLPESEVNRLLKIGRVRLRNSLKELVKNRWPKKFKHLRSCPICIHPQRQIIENALTNFDPSQGWQEVNKKLKRAVGKIFKPQLLLVYHLKYHMDFPEHGSEDVK